jgi:hypothetical protein
MADTGGEHPDADLAVPWLDQLELTDYGRSADLLEDRGTHDGQGRHPASIVAGWTP